jgi:hypothetical protein
MPVCFHCNEQLTVSAAAPVGFRDTCAKCHTDLHVCRNCEFYDEGAHHECRESSAEWVRDKERANRCEYFKLRTASSGSKAGSAKTLAALDDLFKK